MYIRHIDHRSGAPWGPHGREGGKIFSRQSRKFFSEKKGPWGAPWGSHGREGAKKFSRQSRENFFPGKGAPWGGPWDGPAPCAQLKSYARRVGFSFFIGNTQRLKRDRLVSSFYPSQNLDSLVVRTTKHYQL